MDEVAEVAGGVLGVGLAAEDAGGHADDGDQAEDDQEEGHEEDHQPEVILLVSKLWLIEKHEVILMVSKVWLKEKCS